MNHSRWWSKCVACAVGLAVLGFAGVASAQLSDFWYGATNSNWSEPGNWDSGVPTTSHDAIINSDYYNGYSYPILDANGVANSLAIGYEYGGGRLDITGDHTLDVTTNLTMGQNTLYGVAMDLNQSNGTVNVGGYMLVGLGVGTTATVTQTGGTMNVGNVLWVGSYEAGYDGAGVYNLSGGTLHAASSLTIGQQGQGTFNQTGGTVNHDGYLYIADNYYIQGASSVAQGAYVLSAGVFNGIPNAVNHVGVWGGNGTLTVEGTGVMNTGTLHMGLGLYDNLAGSTSFINVRDNAQLNMAGEMLLSANAATVGTLTQTGGTLTVPVLDKGPGTGVYNFTGGTLNVSEVRNMDLDNNGGTVNVAGVGTTGVLTFKQLDIALGKTATQVNTGWGFEAVNAVDGNYTNFSHTYPDDQPDAWWQVDLTGTDSNVAIGDVVLTARYNGYTYALSNFFVRVIDKDGAVVSQGPFILDRSELLDAGESITIDIPDGTEGRYVMVQLNGFNLAEGSGEIPYKACLVMTEVEVLGERFGYNQVGGVLGIELDPTGVAADKVVAGAVSLAGTLDVTSLGGEFAAGQVFDILDWDLLSGTFDTVNLPSLATGLAWDTDDLYVNGELKVVSTVQLPGDADGNGVVNDLDAQLLATNWLRSGLDVGWEQGDFNHDNVVDDRDAAILAAHWVRGGTEGGAVPEPGTWALLATGLIALGVWRKRG